MESESVGYNFENALNGKKYGENKASCTNSLISFEFFITIIIVVGCKENRINENYHHNEAIEIPK